MTKIWGDAHHDPAAALQKTLKDTGLDCVDMFLMHWPCALTPDGKTVMPNEEPSFVETWKKMEKLVGPQCKSIGVSNFTQKTMDILLKEAEIVPAINEVELHAMNPNFKLVPYCQEKGIQVVSWRCVPSKSPPPPVHLPLSLQKRQWSINCSQFCSFSKLGSTLVITLRTAALNFANNHRSTMGQNPDPKKNPLFSHEIFTSIGEKHGVSPGVVSLSWAVQRGIVVIPKSGNKGRIEGNIRLVTLSDEEMARVNSASETIGRHRVADGLDNMFVEIDGKNTIHGWTPLDFGWEDEQGNWLV